MCATDLKFISELITLYQCEDTLKDIYVEGGLDKCIYEWFLHNHLRHDISVYCVDDVDISDELLLQYELNPESNRSKVIALSNELAKAPEIGASILCIADRDNEDYIKSTNLNDHLILTDFHSLESYIINDKCIRKFISIAMGHIPMDSALFCNQITSIAKQLFFIRLTNEHLRLGMTYVNPFKYIHVQRDSITFGRDPYINAYLLSNKMGGRKTDFISTFSTLINNAPDDARLCIRGHDFIDIFHFAAKKLKSGRRYEDSLFFSGAFFSSLEDNDLLDYPLFRRILSL
jgi:hypothetical protein